VRIAPLLVASLVLAAVSAPVALAQTAEAPTRLALQTAAPPAPDLPPQIVATLTTDDGRPVTGAQVLVLSAADVAGERLASLGRATTDATGRARVSLTPRHADYRIVARFDGSDGYAPAEVAQDLRFEPDVVTPFAHVHGSHTLLAPIRVAMPRIITGAVAVLWLGLAWLAVTTVRRIRRAPDLGEHGPAREATT
jgi:hypothetical protein